MRVDAWPSRTAQISASIPWPSAVPQGRFPLSNTHPRLDAESPPGQAPILMTSTEWTIVAIAILIGAVLGAFLIPAGVRWTRRSLAARLGDSPMAGFLDLLNMGYVRWWHRLELVGFKDLPAPFRAGDRSPGIVVANHTAGIDPLLVQAGVRRFIRWMMWADMMVPTLNVVWKAAKILPVSYGAKDTTTVRTAVRHLKDGGLVGVFAEGAISRPPLEVRPFQPGVGLLARLGKAPVLLVHIRDTPFRPTAFGSVFRRSRAVVEVVGIFDLRSEKDPQVAADRLRSAIMEHSGWPANEESLLDTWKAGQEDPPS